MTDDIGPEEDYNTRLSWYLSTAGATGVLSDVAVAYIVVATVLLVLGVSVGGVPPLHLWLAGLTGFAVFRATAFAPTPEIKPSKTGRRVELVKDDVDTFDYPRCDQHGCEDDADRHVRGYKAYYLFGYEISRRLTGENAYCDDHFTKHYPLDGLPVDGATVGEEELEVEEVTR